MDRGEASPHLNGVAYLEQLSPLLERAPGTE
jgi:hypothetical protein